MNYNEIWQRPFELAGNYIFDRNGVMVFTFDFSISEDTRKKVTSLLNDEGKEEPLDFHIVDRSEVWFNDIPIGFFRGWGHLTGVGGLHLDPVDAMNVQDEFIKDCMKKLTEKK